MYLIFVSRGEKPSLSQLQGPTSLRLLTSDLTQLVCYYCKRILHVFFVMCIGDSYSLHLHLGLFKFHLNTWSPEGRFCPWVTLAWCSAFRTSPRVKLGSLSALCSLWLPDCPPGCPSIYFSISPFKATLYDSVCFLELNALIPNPASSMVSVMRIRITWVSR